MNLAVTMAPGRESSGSSIHSPNTVPAGAWSKQIGHSTQSRSICFCFLELEYFTPRCLGHRGVKRVANPNHPRPCVCKYDTNIGAHL